MVRSASMILVAALVAGAASADARAADRRFAVVVGHNDSGDPGLEPLSYADDDALRYGALMRAIADRVIVLAEPDEETRRLGLPGADSARPPTRHAVLGALDEIRAAMDAAREEGDRPVLYFVFSGHGSYDAEGRGFVWLDGGRLTTRDLYRHLFAPSDGDPVILMVDACNAALLVHSRGAARRRAARPSTLKLEEYPNVGVVLASSSVGEVHEWGRYLAGVFSHEIRSGLLGAADLDDDRRVTFAELAAFVASANAEVLNPEIRLKPYIRPPLTDPDLPLVDLDASSFSALVRIEGDVAERAHVVDSNLVRYADFHRTDGRGFWLGVTHPGTWLVVHGEQEHVIPTDARGEVRLAELDSRERTPLSARGARADYFERTLFRRPYEPTFARDYLSDEWVDGLTVRRMEPRPWYENPGGWALLGAGAAALGTATWLQLEARDAEDRARRTMDFDVRAAANDDVERYQAGAWSGFAVGGAAVVGSVLWFVLNRPLEEEVYRPPLQVDVGPTGISLRADL
ncbi:MAG: hypothetical protein ACQEXJ_22285 [Myxococcota bacterium]